MPRKEPDSGPDFFSIGSFFIGNRECLSSETPKKPHPPTPKVSSKVNPFSKVVHSTSLFLLRIRRNSLLLSNKNTRHLLRV